MAPEQLDGKPIAVSDPYARGVITYKIIPRQPLNPELNLQLRAFTNQRRWQLIVTFMVVMVIGILALLRFQSRDGNEPKQIHTTPDALSERHLSFSMEAQRDPKRYLRTKPFTTFDNFIFGAGDQVRFHLSSPQSGSLYIINEGPKQTDGLPNFNVLYPDVETNGGSAKIQAGQRVQIPSSSRHPRLDWFIFDEEEGIENIWFVWSEHVLPELEAVKAWANPKDGGAIRDPKQRASLADHLVALSAIQPKVERDEVSKQTRLKSKGETLMWLMKLEHR